MENALDDFNTPVIHPGLKTKLLIDLIAQVGGLILAIFLLVTGNNDYLPAFIAFYFGVGAYQLISSLVHLYFQRKPTALYRAYYIQLFIHLAFFLSVFTPAGLIGLFALLYLSPLSALYYLIITILTYNEAINHDKK